jgi:hypothetical protein
MASSATALGSEVSLGACHKCPHARDIAKGKFAAVAFEQTPCARCELKEDSLHTIEYDVERGDGLVPDGFVMSGGGEGAAESLATELPIDVMREVVATLLELSPAVRDVVCWRFAGIRYGDIARVQNVTTAAVEARHRRALIRYPVLRSLFPRKAGKQLMRKTHEQKEAA